MSGPNQTKGDKLIPSPKQIKYVNSTGITAFLKAVPIFKMEAVSKAMLEDPEWGAPPLPPTYTVEVKGGDPETHFHQVVPESAEGKGDGRNTLETDDPLETAANMRAWDEYVKRVTLYNGETTERMLRVILLNGVVLADETVYEDDGDWVQELKFQKLPVPDNKFARRYQYMRYEYAAHPTDISMIMNTVVELSGLPKGALGVAADMFLSQV